MGKAERLVTSIFRSVAGGGLYAVGALSLVGIGFGSLMYPDVMSNFAQAALPASAGNFATTSATVSAGFGVGLGGAIVMNTGSNIMAKPG